MGDSITYHNGVAAVQLEGIIKCFQTFLRDDISVLESDIGVLEEVDRKRDREK